MLLYYIRHADPVYDPDQLTPLGHLQAAAAAKRLARYEFDRVYSSSSNRAIQTARPFCELIKKEPVLLDWAHEEGIVQGTTFRYPDGRRNWYWCDPEYCKLFCKEEVRQLGRKWYTHPAFAHTRCGEALEQIQQHADAFMLELGYRHDLENNCYYPQRDWDGRVAFFAHEGFGAAFLSCIMDIPYPEFATRLRMTHSGITVIRFSALGEEVIPQIISYSNDSHLYAEGLPTTHRNRFYI